MTIRDITGCNVVPTDEPKWQNWSRLETSSASLYRPKDIKELVCVVVQAEAQNKRIRAAGSRWSFDDCARPDTDHIAVELSGITWTEGSADFLRGPDEVSSRLRDPGNAIRIANAGAPLWRLNESLWGTESQPGYSLLTLGGSQGQTLAGALSTGTHGTDLELSSLADSVHALHLVGSGGQEYWIEPTEGITGSDMTSYDACDDCIIRIADDDVFESALVSVGRFGILYSILIEVAPRYRLREVKRNSSWLDIPPRLARLRATGDLQSLDDDDDLRAIKINLDPYAVGHGFFGSLERRWNDPGPAVPDQGVPQPGEGPDAVAREVGASQAFADGLLVVPGGTDIYAETARHFFKGQQPERDVLDRNYWVTSGRPTVGHTWEEYYAQFDRFGPFVNSMEFFFDGRTDRAEEFVNRVYQEWRGFLGGYIAVRFSKKSPAKLGPQRFDATVIVEVTLIQGFHDTESVRRSIKAWARNAGALPHWGQENSMTPPEVQEQYGQDATVWRRALATVTRTGNSGTFSNRHSRRLGLELTPALMVQRGGRIRAWFDRRQGLYAANFHQFPAPANVRGLTFKHDSRRVVTLDERGSLYAPWGSLSPAPPPGTLVIKRNTTRVVEIHRNGVFAAQNRERFARWMR